MSKIERTVQMIHEEYSRLCAQAGHVAYQIKLLTDELAAHHETMKKLNTEAGLLAKKEEADKDMTLEQKANKARLEAKEEA